MKAFLDRNYFPYKHDLKYKAKAVGLIVVADMEGIEDTLHTLNQFVDYSFNISKGKKFIVSGYADKLGEACNNPSLIEEARNLGKQMVAGLADGDWPLTLVYELLKARNIASKLGACLLNTPMKLLRNGNKVTNI